MLDLPAIQEIASLPIAVVAMYFMYKLASNHVNHNTAAIEKLTHHLSEQHRTQVEFQGWLRGYFAHAQKEETNSDSKN